MRLTLTLLAVTLLTTGCMGHYTGKPESRSVRNIASRGRSDQAEPILWRQVSVGNSPRSTHIGYLETRVGPGGESHWVYDTNFEPVGRISPRGSTTSVDQQHNEAHEGGFALRHALLKLFGYDRARPVELTPMPEPRG